MIFQDSCETGHFPTDTQYHAMDPLLYFVPILLVIDPFVHFFFKRKDPPKYAASTREIGEQLFQMTRASVKDLLYGGKVRLERLGMDSFDKKFLHSEIFIVHFFVITCVVQGLIKNRAAARDICDAMLGFFYVHLVTRLGFDIAQLEREQGHIVTRFKEYQHVLNHASKTWLLPLSTKMVENIRGGENDNFGAIDSMISEISLILNQVPLVFERMRYQYNPIVPEFFELPPKPELLGNGQKFVL
ncbi:MAG: hypothetical protein HQM16_13030 [Deltaproteobacteria bacterium]|nr:hypothetical protein [Deltaproteobacteria bacterium]